MSTSGISGPGRQLAALSVALGKAGIEPLVVLLQRPGQGDAPLARLLGDQGVEHVVIADRGPLDWRMVSEVRRELDRWGAAVIQTHDYKATAVVSLLRRFRKPRRPWIGFFHGSTTKDLKDRAYDWLGRRLLGGADRIVVMSQVQSRLFAGAGNRVRIIYNAALDPGTTTPAPDGERLAAIARRLPRPILGVVGRLSHEKGVDLFVESCGALRRKGVAFSALIAGDGPERGRLEAQAQRWGIGPDVHFLGHVSGVDVVYKSLDLLVLPSRSEGLPNALLEALRAGVPVVATTVGAVPEVINSSPAARLVPPGSADALAAGIERAMAEGDSPEAAAARRKVVTDYSLERRLEAHIRLYGELASVA